MPLTITRLHLPERVSAPGPTGLKTRVVDCAFDSSYPTNGEALVAADVGLREIVYAVDAGRVAGTVVYGVRYDHLSDKLAAFQASGAEVANATNLSAETARLLVVGR